MRWLSTLVLGLMLAGAAFAGDLSIKAPDGARLHATLDGSGAAGFLLVHGEGETGADLAPLKDALLKAGHTVLVLDLRGHGPNKQALDDAAWAAMTADVQAALMTLARRSNVTKVILVGSGVGATLVLEAAADEPEALDAVLLSPVASAHGHGLGKPLEAWGERATLVMVGADDEMGRRTAGAILGKVKGRKALETVAAGGKGAGLLASGTTPVQKILTWTRETIDHVDAPSKDDIALELDEIETTGKRFGED